MDKNKLLLSLKMRVCACGCGGYWRALPNSTSKYFSITHDSTYNDKEEYLKEMKNRGRQLRGGKLNLDGDDGESADES